MASELQNIFYFPEELESDEYDVVMEYQDDGQLALPLPERLIVRSEPDQVCRTAKLRWRTGSSIGVEFDQEVEPARKQADPEARIQVVCSHLAGSR